MRVAVWVRGARSEASPRSGAPDLTGSNRRATRRIRAVSRACPRIPYISRKEPAGPFTHGVRVCFLTQRTQGPRSLFSRRERGERRERRRLLRRGGVRPPPRAGAAAIDARRCAAQSAKMPPRDFVASGIRRLTGLRFFGRRRYRAAFFGFSPRDFVRRPSPPQARFSRNPGPRRGTAARRQPGAEARNPDVPGTWRPKEHAPLPGRASTPGS